MIEIIHWKMKHIQLESIIVYNDNRILVHEIKNIIWKESVYAMKAEAEVAKIKQLIKDTPVRIDV